MKIHQALVDPLQPTMNVVDGDAALMEQMPL